LAITSLTTKVIEKKKADIIPSVMALKRIDMVSS